MNRELSHQKRKTQRKSRSDEAGFTLLETSIAMVLLAIAGLGVAACFFFAARNNTSARDRELSMAVAQQTMEQYRNAAFTDTALTATATAGVDTTLTRAGRSYIVRTTITDSNAQDGTTRTKTIQVRVIPWSGDDVSRNVTSVFGSVTIICQRTSQSVGPNRAL